MIRAALLLALAASLGAAAAQSPPAPSPKPQKPTGGFPSAVGAWTFETAPVNLNCKLSGTMTISQAGPAGGLTCRFVAVQGCTGDPPLRFEVEQACTAKQTGANVEIESRIVRVMKAEPADLLDAVKANYAPDDFKVAITRRGDEMLGDFHSLSTARVRFVRAVDLTS
jgi:invasion protein IalB